MRAFDWWSNRHLLCVWKSWAHGWQMKMWQTFIGSVCAASMQSHHYSQTYISKTIAIYGRKLACISCESERVHSSRSRSVLISSVALSVCISVCASALRLRNAYLTWLRHCFIPNGPKLVVLKSYLRIPFGIKNQLKYFRCSFRLFSSFFFYWCVRACAFPSRSWLAFLLICVRRSCLLLLLLLTFFVALRLAPFILTYGVVFLCAPLFLGNQHRKMYGTEQCYSYGIVLHNCMRAKNVHSSHLFIYLFFLLPVPSLHSILAHYYVAVCMLYCLFPFFAAFFNNFKRTIKAMSLQLTILLRMLRFFVAILFLLLLLLLLLLLF